MKTKTVQRFIRRLNPKPVSAISVELEDSGAVRVDVDSFIASRTGRKQLRKAHALWSRKEAKTRA